jgi:uncharacterized SAM-binding protein YcdF (DUF218 family)
VSVGRAWLLRLALRPLRAPQAEGPFDVIVVLGAALTPDGRLGPALAERVEAGADAWRRGLASRLLVTGAFEAEAMRRRAVELGVPFEAILLEKTALTTRGNAVASAEILRAEGLRRALVVTQPYHQRRSIAAFRRAGIDAAPLVFESRRNPPRQIAREYVALAIYAVRGWLA